MTELLKKYAAYNLWANKRIIDALSSLPEELLTREIKSSFTSITKTILHMYDAETIWLKRLGGVSLSTWPSKDFNGSPEDALKLLIGSSFEITEYMLDVSNERLQQDCSFKNLEGKEYTMKIYDIIQHCMNHSTFHRGQIITMLRCLDITELPSTDYIAYLRTIE